MLYTFESTIVRTLFKFSVFEEPSFPCTPNPCGPNSICKEFNKQSVCSCMPDYVGIPPACRPECIVSSECPSYNACVNRKCKDPCIGRCGINSKCRVINHSPMCYCEQGYTGDPFLRCAIKRKLYS